MIIDLKRIFHNAEPFYNEPTAITPINTSVMNKPLEYKYIDKWIRQSPEALAIINALVTDILGDGFSFEGGKHKITKAEEFCNRNMFKEEFKKVLWDWFIYGDGYLWKGLLTKEEINTQLGADMIDEDLIKIVKHVPASTMNIYLNDQKTEIRMFKQIIAGIGDSVEWSPEQIIHGKLFTISGRVYGYSPMQASLYELQTICFIKEYAGTYFMNGGTPDFIFNLINENPKVFKKVLVKIIIRK